MAVLLALIVCIAASLTNAANQCTSQGGVCQHSNHHCTGAYHTGICYGNKHNLCCMPAPLVECPTIQIISRAQWGARPPRGVSFLNNPVSRVFIHHTAGTSCHSQTECSTRMRAIQNYHMDTNGWNDIGYSFLVGEDGNVYEGRGWDVVGAHTQGYNSLSYAISFMGNFMSQTPHSSAVSEAQAWIACGIAKGKISNSYSLFGHRDVGSTACPGDALYALIQSWKHFH